MYVCDWAADKALYQHLAYVAACIEEGCITDVDTLVLGIGATMEEWASETVHHITFDGEHPPSVVIRHVTCQMDFVREAFENHFLWDSKTGEEELALGGYYLAIAVTACAHVESDLPDILDSVIDSVTDGMACARDPYTYYGVSQGDFL